MTHLLNLLVRSWNTLARATSTTTLGFLLWVVGITAIAWAAPVVAAWVDAKRQDAKAAFSAVLQESKRAGLYLAGGFLGFVAIAYAGALIATVYKDHQDLAQRNRELIAQNASLSADLEAHRHSIFTTDPVFPNIIYMLQAFQTYRGYLKGAPCVIQFSALKESNALASVFAQFSNSVSGCFTFGAFDYSSDSDREKRATMGAIVDGIVVHAAKNDAAANELCNRLGNQIQITRRYDLPAKPDYQLPPGITGVHVVWMQFGTNVKWNSERYKVK